MASLEEQYSNLLRRDVIENNEALENRILAIQSTKEWVTFHKGEIVGLFRFLKTPEKDRR